MHARIRDVSRLAESFGTELPIVNVTQFIRSTIHLLDVPTDRRFRALLRVYAIAPGAARVRVFDSTAQVADAVLVLERDAADETHPYYAQVQPIPLGVATDRVRIEVDELSGEMPDLWAFVTVTNNETQEVTLVTPQPVSRQDGCSNPATLTISVTPLLDPEPFAIMVDERANIDAVMERVGSIEGVTVTEKFWLIRAFVVDARPAVLEAIRCVPGITLIEQGRSGSGGG